MKVPTQMKATTTLLDGGFCYLANTHVLAKAKWQKPLSSKSDISWVLGYTLLPKVLDLMRSRLWFVLPWVIIRVKAGIWTLCHIGGSNSGLHLCLFPEFLDVLPSPRYWICDFARNMWLRLWFVLPWVSIHVKARIWTLCYIVGSNSGLHLC